MNDNLGEDELSSIIEPAESYQSSSLNCGVSTFLSSSQEKSLKKNMMIVPNYQYNSFSLYNTIMLPFIKSEEIIKTERKIENNNKNNNKLNINTNQLFHSEEINKNEKKFINFLNEKTFNNTISLKRKITYNRENNDIKEIIQKSENYSIFKNFLAMGKNTSNNNISKIDLNIYQIKKISTNNATHNDKNNINKENENIKEGNKDEQEMANYMEKRRSVKIGEKEVENFILNKNENNLGKNKKMKIKNGILNIKSKFKNKTSEKKQISLEKSKKMRSSKINYYFFYNNKNQDKINNGNYFKKIIKKYKGDIEKEEEDENEEDEDMKKIEKTKKIKNNNKNEEIKKENKINKLKQLLNKNKSFHLRDKFNKLKENLSDKNKDKNKDVNIDENGNKKEKNIIINDIKIIKDKFKEDKKSPRKNTNIDSDSEKDEDNSTSKKRNDMKKKTFKIYRKITSERFLNFQIKKNKEKVKDKYDNSNLVNPKNFHISSKIIDPYEGENENKESKKSKSQIMLKKVKRKRNNSLVIGSTKIDTVNRKLKKFTSLNNIQKEISIKKKINKGLIDFEKEIQSNKNKKMQFNLFSQDKFTNTEFSDSDYLKYTLNCMELILDIDKEKQNRLSNKVNFNFPKYKKKKNKKKIALFDLDETLVHCTGDIRTTKEKYQSVIEIKLPGRQEIQVGINVRPYWKQTLKLIKKNYYIVVYTASHQAYADAVLDFMDPKKKYFKYRLYRNNCSLIDVDGAKFYVKDLEILNENYDLKDIVIIDNSVLSFAFHLHNGIPIVPYYNEDKDGSLYVVGLYLMHIFQEDDLREANKKHINLDSFLQEAKRRKEESLCIDENEEEYVEEIENSDENKKVSNKNINDKKSNKNIRDSLRDNSKKFFDQKSILNIKKESISEFFPQLQRKKSIDMTNDKLKSISKLLNMYYEINEQSSKNVGKFNMRRSTVYKSSRLKEKILNSNKNLKDEIMCDKNKIKNIFHEQKSDKGKGESDCKSAHSYLIKQTNTSNAKRYTFNIEESMLRRGLSTRKDLKKFSYIDSSRSKDNHDNANKSIKNQLKFICSNFYNTFKI